ncbi:MAG: type II toxin-antitoxin system RelE/ParE family toxin [Dehalococcoidia bacterium]|nr:type II toxin-antitoxin system RelE/ParE family toxin [Dehalococcoidia bacterium]
MKDAYRVLLHKEALKDYKRQVGETRARLEKAFDHLSQTPYQGAAIKRLSGELSHLFRYRVGELRIIYEVHEDLKVVRVKAIGRRGDVYK